MHYLIFIFMVVFSSLSSAAAVSCPGIIRANSLPKSQLQVRDIAVDYNMGLIQFMGYDPKTDIGKVFIFDDVYAKKLFNRPQDRAQLASLALYIPNFSRRRIAKIGTENSAKIIRSRINDFFGLDHIAIYFALYPIIQRLRPQSLFYYKAEYVSIIRKHFPELNGDTLPDLLKYFREQTFRRFTAQNDTDSDFSRLYPMILELSHVTHENLFHTGILATFARRRFSNWVWPINSGPYSFDSPTSGLVNVRLGVPRDIDHYARSWIWGATKDIDIGKPEVDDNPSKIFHVRNYFYQRSPADSRPNVTVRLKRKISPFFITYYQADPFWLRIFEVAASSDIKPRFVEGQVVRFILPEDNISRAERIAEEIKRVGYDAGALQVEVLVERMP